VKLFLKNSNLCDHNSPTSQTDGRTDGQTDDMRSQYRALHYSASRGKNTLIKLITAQPWNSLTCKHTSIHCRVYSTL